MVKDDSTNSAKQAVIKAVRDEYVAGQLSVSEIARRNDVPESTIRHWAKQYGWTRNLSKAVRNQVQSELLRGSCESPLEVAEEQRIIDAAARRGVEVVKLHRQDLAKLRGIAYRLTEQLEAQLPALVTERLLPMIAPEGATESLEAAAKILDSLTRTQAKLIPLERQAFDLDGPTEADDPLSTLLKQIDGQTKGLAGLTEDKE